jgi:hypothetical protein
LMRAGFDGRQFPPALDRTAAPRNGLHARLLCDRVNMRLMVPVIGANLEGEERDARGPRSAPTTSTAFLLYRSAVEANAFGFAPSASNKAGTSPER